MRYLGGKFRIAKSLSAYLESRRAGRYFVEPFCGGLNVTAAMAGERVASDASQYLFTLYSALLAGWDPPTSMSEDEYAAIRARNDPEDPLTAFAGYGCSFGGKWFGGFCRDGTDRNYASGARNGLLKKMAKCKEVTFALCSYERMSPEGCLVYCDPPYAATTGYGAVGAFDSVAFWAVVREWSKVNTVLVSEYAAPDDFACVWSVETKTDMHGEGRKGRMEKLFEYTP